jgi:mRNA-degrading endonuclease RelE of RelBE toxin-antitoxin system
MQKIPPKERAKILKKLDLLITNHQVLDIKKLQDFQTLYRIQCGNYRIVYSRQCTEQTFLVALICHRQDVYKQLKNFIGILR